MKILVTGATGYIGGRLVPRLLMLGYDVRVMVRNPERLAGRSWVSDVHVVKGDVLQPESLERALQDVKAAYYLIHSMQSGDDFHLRDLEAAKNFGSAAENAGVEHIIYVGGLGDYEKDLSEHLKSRQDTGRELARSEVPVTEFRAAVIVGSGSISFEMIRYLTERIPVMICPRWVFTKTQPIGIDDVLQYLTEAIVVPASKNRIIEIGGSDVLTYGEMMMGYAKARELKRYMIPVPFLTPRLSAYWVHWMTPVSAEIAHALVEGLRNEAVVLDNSAKEIFPDIEPVNYLKAVRQALEKLEIRNVETRWTDALVSSMGTREPELFTFQEGMIIESRQLDINSSEKDIFDVLQGLGGENGWLYLDWAWRLRGVIDRLLGGVGLRRGRRDPDILRKGDAVDFWRVEDIDEAKMIRFRSEMITPGEAWLQYDLRTINDTDTNLVQTAYFVPRGLAGLLYWYILYPIHGLVFTGMINAIKEHSEHN